MGHKHISEKIVDGHRIRGNQIPSYFYRLAGGERQDYLGDPETSCFQTCFTRARLSTFMSVSFAKTYFGLAMFSGIINFVLRKVYE